MSVMTHESRWRLLVGAAPVIGVAFFVWAAAQGQGDVARSVLARAILAGVAALGMVVAWVTARQLRMAPALPVSKAGALAQSGQLAEVVALHGRARALPDAVPLVSPDGELCLWFSAGDEDPRHDSVRPFLLEDDSGECVVLPGEAVVTGQSAVSAAAARSRLGEDTGASDPESNERVLRNGDRVHVVGRFVAASPEALVLQAQAASLVARSEAAQAQWRGGGDPLPFRDLRSAALAGGAFVAAPTPAGPGLLLPVIAAPRAGQPLRIRIGADEAETEGGLYGALAVVDCLVLLVSSSLAAWSLLAQS